MTTKENMCFSSFTHLILPSFALLRLRLSINSHQSSKITVSNLRNSLTLLNLDCEVLACSVDSHFTHMEWTKKKREEGGLGDMSIPMLSDLAHKIAKDYGALHPDGHLTFRATYIIDDKGILRHVSINDNNVGRNAEEYLRLVQGFQFADKHGEVCPASWKPGAKTMVPDIKSEKTKAYWKEEHAK